jgi:hypothetical protein
MKLLALVPIQYRLTAIFLLVVAVFGYGWTNRVNNLSRTREAISEFAGLWAKTG